jgi:D-alanine-D-alanine ligase
VLEADEPTRLAIRGSDLPEVDADRSPVALMGATTGTDLVVTEPSSVPSVIGEVDVVFPLLHGPWGEDGTLQGMLEMAGVRYVGSGVLASAIGMDKAYMKIVLEAAGLPVTPGIIVTRSQWEQDPIGVRTRVEELGFPSFAKPARAGSSMGISKVHDATEVDDAFEDAFRHDPKVLVEQSMEGAREVECGVLGTLEGPPETSRPGEVRTGGDHEFYDFEAKYLADQHTEIDIPADLDAETEQELRAMAVRAFEALSCEGLARVDFFVMPDGSLVINELNTMPGFTPTSMYPQMWAESGVSYPELVDRLITLALERDTGLR